MKHNLPYLINLPPFLLKDLDTKNLRGLSLVWLILKGKILSILINNTKKKFFCFVINIFFKKDGKIIYSNKKYKKITKNGQEIFYPNKRILRVVKSFELHLNRLFSSYCLDKIVFLDGDTVLDCGANVGELNIAFNQKKINVKYIAFEPDEDNFESLKQNISSNDENLYKLALSNVDGTTNFYVDNEGGNSSIVDFGTPHNVEINTIRLDSLNLQEDIKLFKLEAEGFEPEVLLGSIETLKSTEYVSIDYGAERGISQEMTIVDCNKILYENNFSLVNFSEYRLIGLYRNNTFNN